MRAGIFLILTFLLMSVLATTNIGRGAHSFATAAPFDGSTIPSRSGPVAAFTYVPCVMCAVAGDAVFFNANYSASLSGPIVSYVWNFGDGSSLVKTTNPAISHIYPGFPGEWKVILAIYDSLGRSDSITQLVMFETLPTFTIQPAGPLLGKAFTLNASESKSYNPQNPIKNYAWDFGDGGNATGKVVQHTYTLSGIYRVSLALLTANGNPQASKTVRVPHFVFTSLFQGFNVTATGDILANSTSHTVTGAITITVLNATSGAEFFSKTYNVTIAYSSASRPGFLLVASTPSYGLGLGCLVDTDSSETSCVLSKNPDLTNQGIVNILDAATLAFSYGTTTQSANWNSNADLDGDGQVALTDAAIIAFEFEIQVFH